MLFSSQAFVLLFLPVVLSLFYLCARLQTARLGVLFIASSFFYAWWDVRFLPLLLATIGLNWWFARRHLTRRSRWAIPLGVALNLLVIGIFKYTDFFAAIIFALLERPYQPMHWVLPLGISFFTFQQISYLIDVRRGSAPRYSLLAYANYVSFFPQLIAGPIVRHHELVDQFKISPLRPGIGGQFARGLVLFVLGFAKKVWLADELAPLADAIFARANDAHAIATLDAWSGALAYSLQLYFDFSAYSDMAIGLAAMFGLALPENFQHPYRAPNVREFWRRWHISLSRFLRDYLYIPLGGNRGHPGRVGFALACTMLLGGLWHGAGWTFVAWGAVHGIGLIVHRCWISLGVRLPRVIACSVTFLFVMFAWVLFRAESFTAASYLLNAMLSLDLSARANLDAEAGLLLGLGAGLAIAGPNNVELSRSTKLKRVWVAILCGFILVASLLRVGTGRGLEFIYFQF